MRATVAVLCAVAALCPWSATADVTELWQSVFDNPEHHADTEAGVLVDPTGAVLVVCTSYQPSVVGYAYSLIKYEPNGDPLWERQFTGAVSLFERPPAVWINGAGDIFMAAYTLPGGTLTLSTWRLAADGTSLWEQHRAVGTCLSTSIFAPDVAVDADENVYVVGSIHCDLLVRKYDASGTPLWEQTYGDPNEADVGTGVAVDAAGNVFVAGALDGASGGYATVKYDPNGAFLWQRTELGPLGTNFDRARVLTASNGDVIVAGEPETTFGLPEIMVWCYDTDGTLRWLNHVTETFDSVDFADLALDGADNVIVAGSRGAFPEFLAVSFTPAGQQRWSVAYPFDENNGLAEALTVDQYGNAYLTGYAIMAAQDRDYLTLKVSSAGNLEWTTRHPHSFGGNDVATGVAVGADGRVYVTGTVWNGPATNQDVITLKYVQSGPGDLNCDGAVTFADINAFVQALIDPPAYLTQYPECDILDADLDGGGTVGFEDINPFVTLLVGT